MTNKKTEKLDADKRDAIVKRFLQQLIERDPALYYAPTPEIARKIYHDIRDRLNTLDFDEQVLVKALNIDDIKVILSYHG